MFSDYDFQKYKYIQIIAEEKSISKAASRLYLSQPFLSKLLGNIEASLGVVLFERNNTAFKVTAAGKIFLDYIEKMFILRDDLLSRLSEIYEGDAANEKFSFGISQNRSSDIIPKTFISFAEQYPNTRVDIIETYYSEIVREVLNKTITIGLICPYKVSSKLAIEPISEEYLLLMLPPNHPLGTEEARGAYKNPPPFDSQKLEELCKTPCIAPSERLVLGTLVKNSFDQIGYSPEKYVEINSLDAGIGLVSHGVGFGLFPTISVVNSPCKDDAFYYTFGSPPIQWNQVFCYRKDTIITPSMRKFMQIVKETYLELILS